MTQPSAILPVQIVGQDRTAKAAKSAEKRLGAIPKHVSAVNQRADQAADRRFAGRSRAAVRTFGAVEQAAARAFGGRSMTSGLTSRLSAVREAASAAGTGLGEVATAGGAVSGALGAVGIAAGATVGVLAAAGYAAFKLADGWAKGAASIGRTAEIIGVASKQLQEFNAAAARQGVDQGTATSAIGGLSQTLNDARYGRNNDAVALLSRLGVKLKLNPDGTVDTGAMLPAIADALARQNSSGRRTAGRILGIPDAALPAFTQGSAKLGADMKDADQTAYVATPGEIEAAKRIQRKEAIVGQMKDRALGVAGAATAQGGEGALDTAIAAGRSVISGTQSFGGVVRSTFAPAAEKIEHAAERMLQAASTWGEDKVRRLAATGQRLRQKFEGLGLDRAGASAMAAMAVAESGGDAHRHQRGGPAYGLFQWEAPRQRMFAKRYGKDIRQSSEDEQIAYALWELSSGGSEARAGRKIAAAGSAGDKADAATRFYERPKNMDVDAANRAELADAIARGAGEIPLKIDISFRNAPPGTHARATAGRGKPAVSHAAVG